jgi:hypothetical protein
MIGRSKPQGRSRQAEGESPSGGALRISNRDLQQRAARPVSAGTIGGSTNGPIRGHERLLAAADHQPVYADLLIVRRMYWR